MAQEQLQKLLLNFTGGSTARIAPGETSSRVASWARQHRGLRSQPPLPTGGYLEQADGTAWMALFCQNMLEIAVELAMTDPDYEDMALKFCRAFPVDRLGDGAHGRGHGDVG